MLKLDHHYYQFGSFRADPVERLLLREDHPIPITTKAFDTLLILLERSGHLVSKAELMKLVWRDAFVEEGNLTVTISMLRKALGDDGPEHKFIQTVPKQGYRFLADVQQVEVDSEPAVEASPSALPPTQKQSSDATASIAHPPIEITPVKVELPASSLISKARSHWAVAFSLLALAIVASGFMTKSLWSIYSHKQSSREIKSLAVLPFQVQNFGGNEYLGVGMADAIITRLAASEQVVVRPTTAVMPYVDSPGNAVSIGRQQDVDAVLVGNIDAAGNEARVNVQLLRVADGKSLWSGLFRRKKDQLAALEAEVEEGVIKSLNVGGEPIKKSRIAGTQTQNPTAYKLYMEGRYFWNKRTEDGLRRSIEYFQRATLEDQRYASAFAGLADSYTLLASYGVEPFEQAYPNAKAAALKALQIDNQLSEAYASLGMIAFYYEWNWSQAEMEFRRSIELNPNYAMAHTWYALNLAAMGRFGQALSEIERAHELDPVSLITNTEIGRVFYWSRQYDKAIEAFKKATDLDPQFARAHTRLGMAFAAKKDFGSAMKEFKEAQRLSGADPYLDGLMGYSLGLSGNTVAARRILQDLTSGEKYKFVPAFSIALVSIGLNDREGALKWIEKSYEDRSTYLVYSKVDPLLDSIRSEPRFTDLLTKMTLLSSDESLASAK